MQDENEGMKSVILIDVEEEFKECNFKTNASFKSYFNWVFCLFVCSKWKCPKNACKIDHSYGD